MKTERKTIACWSVLSPWTLDRNGSKEQRIYTYQVYSADYYGNGEKLYLSQTVHYRYEFRGQVTPVRQIPGGYDDGNLERIQKVADRSGITLI